MAGKPKWHIEIRNYLDDELTDKDLENLKFSLKDSVLEGPRTDNSIGFGRKNVQELKTVFQLLDFLEKRRFIESKVKNYDNLIKGLRVANIDEAANRIEEIIAQAAKVERLASAKVEPLAAVKVESPRRPRSLNMTRRQSSGESSLASPDAATFLCSKRMKASERVMPDQIYSSSDNPYPFKNPRVVIINNFTRGKKIRQGTKQDADKIKNFFSQRKIDCEIFEDQKTAEMLELCKQEAQNELNQDELNPTDGFMLFILSHGNKEGVIGFYETEEEPGDSVLSVDSIIKIFDRCKRLRGKPKVFVIAACHGTEANSSEMAEPDNSNARPCSGFPPEEEEEEGENEVVEPDNQGHISTPNGADTLIAYASVKGFESYRSRYYGTWFIDALMRNLRESPTRDFMEILTTVNREVSSRIASKEGHGTKVSQMPCFTSSLRFRLFIDSEAE